METPGGHQAGYGNQEVSVNEGIAADLASAAHSYKLAADQGDADG
jgi:hypothetical protein